MTHWVEPNNMLTKAFNTLTYVYENTMFKGIFSKMLFSTFPSFTQHASFRLLICWT